MFPCAQKMAPGIPISLLKLIAFFYRTIIIRQQSDFFWACSIIFLLEKVIAPHSSSLVWKIPWIEEPGGLQSMVSWRVRYDWTTSLSLFTFMHWRRKWQPTPVFLPGESQGWGRLVGCRLWGLTESDTTERLNPHTHTEGGDNMFKSF